jgi:glycosyltransferase involved in cell wall biosynthesis
MTPSKGAISSEREVYSPAERAPAVLAEFEVELIERKPRKTEWPKITLVTAVYNGEEYLEATIRSIVNQEYPNLEYIVVNDGSTDGTVEIIRKYERAVSCWFSQSNQGLYAALNAGFARSTGEIMGWLNSSDLLQVNGLFTVGSIFRELRDVEWITGRITKISATGMTIDVLPVRRWSRGRFLAGANKYIQQESSFWRRSLWERAGGKLSTEYRAEGDFELWVRFFRHAQLYSVNALIGGYRLHDDALSSSNMDRYNRNCDEIAAREVERLQGSKRAALKAFRWISEAVKPIPKVRGLWYRAAIRGLYRVGGPDWPPVIEYGEEGESWRLRR